MKTVKQIFLPKRLAAILFLFTSQMFLFFENSYAQNSKWIAPKDADNLKNPVQSNPVTLKEGKTLYATYCVACHGEKGKGDGAAASGLAVKPADHSSAVVQNQSDGAIFWYMSEGRNPMPSYKQAFTETQRWELVNYIRTLAKTPKK